MADLDPEDAKLVTLAQRARSRTGAPEAAAVRDPDGRTYVATTVTQPSFHLTALQAAVAAAVSSGVQALEAAVVVTDSAEIDPAAAVDLNAKVLQVNAETRTTRLVGT